MSLQIDFSSFSTCNTHTVKCLEHHWIQSLLFCSDHPGILKTTTTFYKLLDSAADFSTNRLKPNDFSLNTPAGQRHVHLFFCNKNHIWPFSCTPGSSSVCLLHLCFLPSVRGCWLSSRKLFWLQSRSYRLLTAGSSPPRRARCPYWPPSSSTPPFLSSTKTEANYSTHRCLTRNNETCLNNTH